MAVNKSPVSNNELLPSENESENESSTNEEESVSDEGESVSDEVNVDIEFYDPKDNDFDELKALVTKYLDDNEFDSSGMADTIIKQSRVGSVIKCGSEDESPLGFITVFNFELYKNEIFMKQIIKFLENGCPNEENKKYLHQYISDPASGLIINERLFNCPYQIGPPLNQSLFEEIHWAQTDEPTEELRQSYKFNYYVILTRVYEVKEPETQNIAKPKKKKSKLENGIKSLVYIRPEDEFYHKLSSFSWVMEQVISENEGLDEKRLVIGITHNQAQESRKFLDKSVGNPAADAYLTL